VENPVSAKSANALKKIHFGSQSKNLYDVLRIFIQQLKKHDINERAGSMAFSYTIALFPLLLFLLNLVPYLQLFFPLVTTANILSFVQDIIPADVYSTIESTLLDIISKPRQSLLSLGFFFALFASTQGVVSMMNSFNAVYKTKENRSWSSSRGIAIAIVLALVVTVSGSKFRHDCGQLLDYRIEGYAAIFKWICHLLVQYPEVFYSSGSILPDLRLYLPLCPCDPRQVAFFLHRRQTGGALDYAVFLRVYFLFGKLCELQQAVRFHRNHHRLDAMALPHFRDCARLLCRKCQL
jgi:hypothetical protein